MVEIKEEKKWYVVRAVSGQENIRLNPISKMKFRD